MQALAARFEAKVQSMEMGSDVKARGNKMVKLLGFWFWLSKMMFFSRVWLTKMKEMKEEK